MGQPILFTADVLRALRTNGEAFLRDHRPVLKLFNPYGAAVWLLSELDPAEPDHIYGLADLGAGCPELGWTSRDGLETAYVQRGAYRLPLERDQTFAPRHTLAVYTHAARLARYITENPDALDRSAAALCRPVNPPP